ncbi:MAG: glycosyltransferase [Bacteroidetes bacterium]|nr:glycosyltransferase [Bacteroidota bacterium]
MLVIVVLTILLTLFYALLFTYYLFGWLTLKNSETTSGAPSTKISVIIPVRNEEESIGDCLGDLANQDYPKELFEIIVVDDHSTDDTLKVISAYQANNIKVLEFRDENVRSAFKKQAINLGIENATGDLIMTTDADCRMNEKWLSGFAGYYEQHRAKMISGPVVYKPNKSLLQKFQALDFTGLIGVGAATISNGSPQVCNGANLAYEKEAFHAVGGFEGVNKIASGDDMLLMQKIARKYPNSVRFIKNRDTIVYTTAPSTLSEFISQRQRWTSKATKLINKKVTIILGAIFVFNLAILLNTVLALFFPVLWPLLTFQIMVKFLVEFMFLSLLTYYFRNMSLLWLFLLFQPLHVLYIVFIALLGQFKQYTWKGRRTN